MLKIMFKVLVILPILVYLSGTAGGHIVGGTEFSWGGAVIAGVIAAIAYIIWDGKQEDVRFNEHVKSLGVNPEYIACYAENGIAIDNTNEKLFVGQINKGVVFEFGQISSIEWEDRSILNSLKYNIIINTTDFALPQMTIGFAGNRLIREQAFAKLRAALKIS